MTGDHTMPDASSTRPSITTAQLRRLAGTALIAAFALQVIGSLAHPPTEELQHVQQASVWSMQPEGVGLRSMRERADELGGSCSVAGAAGEGTVVRVSLPRSTPVVTG